MIDAQLVLQWPIKRWNFWKLTAISIKKFVFCIRNAFDSVMRARKQCPQYYLIISINFFSEKLLQMLYTSQNNDEDVRLTQNNSNNQQPVEMKLNFLFVSVFFFSRRQQVNTRCIYLFVFLPVSVSFRGKETLYFEVEQASCTALIAFSFQCIIIVFCLVFFCLKFKIKITPKMVCIQLRNWEIAWQCLQLAFFRLYTFDCVVVWLRAWLYLDSFWAWWMWAQFPIIG